MSSVHLVSSVPVKAEHAPKRSPGPWRAEEVGQCGSADNPVPVFEVTNGHARIAEYVFEGDAYLMAAAPELLTALQNMVAWLDDGNRQLSDSCAADVAKARTAIAKAFGRIA